MAGYNYSKPKKVTVYDPKGKPHEDTVANARDLVNNCGYTWEPGQTNLTPASNAPAKIRPKKTPVISAAQEVLDSATKTGASAPEADADEPDETHEANDGE